MLLSSGRGCVPFAEIDGGNGELSFCFVFWIDVGVDCMFLHFHSNAFLNMLTISHLSVHRYRWKVLERGFVSFEAMDID
jgi:hypothetical protein